MSELGISAVEVVEVQQETGHEPRLQTLSERKILGVKFYVGNVERVVDHVSRGGLLVVPAAPALKEIATNPTYREALTQADVAIPDSAFMVLVWNFIQRDSIDRLSGLKYLRELLKRPDVREPGNTLWVMARPESARKNLLWLESQGIAVPEEYVYIAPMYGTEIEDKELVDRLNRIRPRHVVITVGGGVQECLGLHLKRKLTYLPGIHCIGAAIAFLSGDQVRIPEWADRLYLGWLFRCLSSPKTYVWRYGAASSLLPLIWRYRSQLPV
jgi:UDP-N-acetyl-D-mannosaminuronic acid transferase (WecB/TagA/CpsF family)